MVMVGPVGIEPTRVLTRRILSPLRLPVPPQPRAYILLIKTIWSRIIGFSTGYLIAKVRSICRDLPGLQVDI
jgi:hypothetical protein